MATFTVYKGTQSGQIVSSQTTKPALSHDQVLLSITASGLCGTDLHYRNAAMALGHEGVGIVRKTGPDVKHLKVGDRVGWGYEHDSCGDCQQCLQGTETYCANRAMYGEADLDQGSFASQAVWREAFLFKVPEGMSDADAAPLMCGGATVFNALRLYDVKPTDHVGIIGVGGLGHLAIQFASKQGCHTSVFSGTDSKKDEAMSLGAKDFYATKGVSELKVSRPVNVLLVTASVQVDWKLYMPVMAPGGMIFPLSVAGGDFVIPYMEMLQKGLRIQGSIVAPRHIHKQMLEFAAEHGIRPMINTFTMNEEGINKAMGELEAGHLRYRGVLIPQTVV